MVASLPVLDWFPDFAATYSPLSLDEFQCIWYLPDKDRRCLLTISAMELHLLRLFAEEIVQEESPKLGDLSEIAQLSCCARHHRNKIWGSGLAQELALRWRDEIKQDRCITVSDSTVAIKTEEAFPPAQGIVEDHESDYKVKSREPTPIEFAKHALHSSETIQSALLSSIRPSDTKPGSTYIFTIRDVPFEGMIKIGYTGKSVNLRLEEWAECGHGRPHLLKSFSNVRYPERVELLTHLELTEHWHDLRWCDAHSKAHIEWFKIDFPTASKVLQSWSQWVERANPYHRISGRLKAHWLDIVQFLSSFDINLTGTLMVAIQDVEDGIIKTNEFLDDDALRDELRKAKSSNVNQ